MQRLVGSDNQHAVLHDLGGTGPSLLFTHGNGLNSGMWATVLPQLMSDFHCWGLDFRGHGASRASHDQLSVKRSILTEEIMQAVEHIAKQSGITASTQQIAAVGHSLGAACLLLAELAQPGMFSALWLYEPVLIPIGHPRQDGPAALIEAARRRRTHFDSTQAAFDRLTSKPPFSGCEPAAVHAYLKYGSYPTDDGIRLSCSGNTEANVYEATGEINFDQLEQITPPTVLALGGTPAPANELPPLLAKLIAKALGNGSVETFDKLSHFGPMEDGAQIAAAIHSHLAS